MSFRTEGCNNLRLSQTRALLEGGGSMEVYCCELWRFSFRLQRVVTKNMAVHISATLETSLPCLYRRARRQREFSAFSRLKIFKYYTDSNEPVFVGRQYCK